MNIRSRLNLSKKLTIVGLRGTFHCIVVYEDTKNKQNKMEQLADKLCVIQTFLLPHHFLFLISSSSVSLL